MRKKDKIRLARFAVLTLAVFLLFSASIPLPDRLIKKKAQKEVGKLINGKWEINGVSVSVFNGLIVRGVSGLPSLPMSGKITVAVSSVKIKPSIIQLIKGNIVPNSINMENVKVCIAPDGASPGKAVLSSVVASSALLPLIMTIPANRLSVESLEIEVSGFMQYPLFVKVDKIKAIHGGNNNGEGTYSGAMIKFGNTRLVNKLKGSINVKHDDMIEVRGKGKALSGVLEIDGRFTKAGISNMHINVERGLLGDIALSNGKLGGYVNAKVQLRPSAKTMHLGSAQIQIEKFVAQDFSFQNEPHIEWLMPAVKVMKLDEVNTRILFKDNLLDIVSFDGHGEGIRTQLTGRMDYSGRLNSQMKLFLYGGMIREIPYLSSKALPKNANGEYEIPITLSGNFPDLEVKVNLSLVTRAVGGILRDALKTFF